MATKDYKKNVESKMRLEENKKCVDCGASNPRWASCKYGIFLCLECAGIHRALGVNYDFIKSATLDQWSREYYMIIKYGGNGKFMNFLKTNNVGELEILDKYRNPTVMSYSKRLVEEIKKATGEILRPAEATITNTTEAYVKEKPVSNSTAQNLVYINSTRNNSATQLLKDTTETLRNKLGQYSPALANISTNAINKVSDISSSIYNHTKSLGAKTFMATAKLSSKIIEEAKNLTEKKQHSVSKASESIKKQSIISPMVRRQAESKDWS